MQKEAVELRDKPILRFLLQNVGGLLAVLSVIFSSGMIMQQTKELQEKSVLQDTAIKRVDQTTQDIKVDVAVIRERVNNQNSRILTLENNKK